MFLREKTTFLRVGSALRKAAIFLELNFSCSEKSWPHSPSSSSGSPMLSLRSCFSSRFRAVWLARSRRQPMGETLRAASRSASLLVRCWKERTPWRKWRLTYLRRRNSASSDLESDFRAVSMTMFLNVVSACCGFILLTMISLPCQPCVSSQVRFSCPPSGLFSGSLLRSSGSVWHLLLIFLRMSDSSKSWLYLSILSRCGEPFSSLQGECVRVLSAKSTFCLSSLLRIFCLTVPILLRRQSSFLSLWERLCATETRLSSSASVGAVSKGAASMVCCCSGGLWLTCLRLVRILMSWMIESLCLGCARAAMRERQAVLRGLSCPCWSKVRKCDCYCRSRYYYWASMRFFNNNTTLHRRQAVAHHYMFDQEEQKLLQQALRRATKDYHNNCNVYPVSAFDPAFDLQLSKLVLFYSFDFEAIALHLYFKFPQYSSRLKPQAVAYRWYQLALEQNGASGEQQQEMTIERGKEEWKEEKRKEQDEEMTVEEQESGSAEQGDKKLQFEAAMMVASTLDEEEQEGFMLYSPKFIVDSEFKLQRTPSQNSHLLALLHNRPFEFGPFEPPQAAPFDYSLYQPQQQLPSAQQAEAEQEEYLDEDWQAYESD